MVLSHLCELASLEPRSTVVKVGMGQLRALGAKSSKRWHQHVGG